MAITASTHSGQHLTMQGLADRYGIALQTVRAWRVTGYGPRGFRVGKFVRYRLADCLAWEEQQLDPQEERAA
ncbi:DNA-binding protein [Kocuria aegyptia]|uniref:DNA-binding protein n=1 Tax=Kocuria aegyptia TaxID=330943 RepID=A0ABP4XGE7_9MICC